ncbi:MAG: DUF1697 domain-containing protein [Acidobacteria bacterium]|nr:DUF1697 domain-containing protein [Acidobacteriota bacterium]
MRYIALLRGINVGGNTMIKMEELRKTFEALGFANVKTYINSGNLAFDVKMRKPAQSTGETGSSVDVSCELEAELTTQIESAIAKDFEKQIPVMVREQADIKRILASNPFDGQFESHKEMHVLFLKEEMPKEKRDQLLDAAPIGERFEAVGREIYCHLPMGVADSLLGKSFIEKKLKLAVTGRNWRTIEKLSVL